MEINKKLAFEYFVYQLHNWYKEANGKEPNDLSVLKVLKLLFFTSSVGSSEGAEDLLLDKVFNNFVAMPFGHVESNIYNLIRESVFENIQLDSHQSKIKNSNAILSLDNIVKIQIDDKILKLKKINFYLITYSSFDLVELSHKWYSWKKNYQIAQEKGQFSYPIKTSEIKSEIKFYQ